MFVGGATTPPARAVIQSMPGLDLKINDKVIATTCTGKSCLVVLDPRDSTAALTGLQAR